MRIYCTIYWIYCSIFSYNPQCHPILYKYFIGVFFFFSFSFFFFFFFLSFYNLDMESPVFVFCPQNQTHPTERGRATAVVVRNYPKAVDNSNQKPNITCIPKSGTRLPIGQINVNCSAQDKSDNMAKCNFVVDVQGNQLWLKATVWVFKTYRVWHVWCNF